MFGANPKRLVPIRVLDRPMALLLVSYVALKFFAEGVGHSLQMAVGSLHLIFFGGGIGFTWGSLQGAGEAYTKGSSLQGVAGLTLRVLFFLLCGGVQGLTWWAWEGNYGPALYPALAPSSGGMFYQRADDDKEIATEWGDS